MKDENMREEFKRWFITSKYRQVIVANEATECIALDAWQACAAKYSERIAELEQQVAMLRDTLKDAADEYMKLPHSLGYSITHVANWNSSIHDLEQNAEAYKRRVQAEMLEELIAKIRSDFGATSLFLLMRDMAAKLREGE